MTELRKVVDEGGQRLRPTTVVEQSPLNHKIGTNVLGAAGKVEMSRLS